MDIPIFPEAKPVALEDKPLFDRVFSEDPPLASEYTFTNIFAWRKAYRFRLSYHEGMILLSAGGAQGHVFYDPLGKGDKARLIRGVLRFTGGSFTRIPEATASILGGDQALDIRPDPDNEDYRYSFSDLAGLAGRKYDGKRNLIRKFKSSCEYEYCAFDSSSVARALAVADQWCLVKGCDTQKSLDDERTAIREMVAHHLALGFGAAGIVIGDEVRAFAFGEKLNPDTLVVHILKADTGYPGLYQTMLNEFLTRRDWQAAYVNLEQDMGIAGLRDAKKSYHPESMVRKYRISLKG